MPCWRWRTETTLYAGHSPSYSRDALGHSINSYAADHGVYQTVQAADKYLSGVTDRLAKRMAGEGVIARLFHQCFGAAGLLMGGHHGLQRQYVVRRRQRRFATGDFSCGGGGESEFCGAAAVVVTSQEFATAHGLRPLVRIVASATAGTEPGDLFIAPVIAIQKVLDRARVSPSDIDLFEINEAFAVQMLACLRRLGLSSEITNINGGAIAMGHPLGASGARVLATLIHAMIRRQARFGVAALCLGGGNAVAMLVERV